MSVRIAPALPPYPEAVREDFAKIMPPGMEPIALFRTLAKNPRVLRRIRRGALLDRGSISLRQREIVILRTTALCGAEYEWGVHVQFFAAAAQLDAAALYATVWGAGSSACWTEEEATLIEACDELHRSCRISDALFTKLRTHFGEAQVIELLVLAGLYRTISYAVNGTGLALEATAPRFPPRSPE